MCGRYTLSRPDQLIEELAAETGGLETHGIELEPRYNVAPTQDVATVRQDEDGRRHLGLLRWGLVPFWAKDVAIGNRMINARSETVAEKPSFRAAFRRRRCLVPTDGFYEWKKVDGGKQPVHIRRRDRRPLYFAGLWERWEKGDEPLETCTILTTSASETVAEAHDRMPVILDLEGRALWLDAEAPPEVLDTVLHPWQPAGDDDALEIVMVSRLVNNPRNDVARCLEPVEP